MPTDAITRPPWSHPCPISPVRSGHRYEHDVQDAHAATMVSSIDSPSIAKPSGYRAPASAAGRRPLARGILLEAERHHRGVEVVPVAHDEVVEVTPCGAQG